MTSAARSNASVDGPGTDSGTEDRPFPERFVELFDAHFGRLFRYLNRLSGDSDLAADLTQEAFIRLFHRGAMPDVPSAWLVSCAMNLLRNSQTTAGRRHRLLTVARGEHAHSDPAPSAAEAVSRQSTRQRVRAAIERLPERDRHLLLLRAEGFSYREIAAALDLHEASVGTLLARARGAFRDSYGSSSDEA